MTDRAITDPGDPWAQLPEDHPQRHLQCRYCGTTWVAVDYREDCERICLDQRGEHRD